MKTRSVVIHRLSIRSDPADGPVKNVTLTAYVSKGTYIRSLARDIALALGTVGHVAMLRRTRAGPFTLDQAISLDRSEEHTSELQSLMRISYAVLGLKKTLHQTART